MDGAAPAALRPPRPTGPATVRSSVTPRTFDHCCPHRHASSLPRAGPEVPPGREPGVPPGRAPPARAMRRPAASPPPPRPVAATARRGPTPGAVSSGVRSPAPAVSSWPARPRPPAAPPPWPPAAPLPAPPPGRPRRPRRAPHLPPAPTAAPAAGPRAAPRAHPHHHAIPCGDRRGRQVAGRGDRVRTVEDQGPPEPRPGRQVRRPPCRGAGGVRPVDPVPLTGQHGELLPQHGAAPLGDGQPVPQPQHTGAARRDVSQRCHRAHPAGGCAASSACGSMVSSRSGRVRGPAMPGRGCRRASGPRRCAGRAGPARPRRAKSR